MAAGATALIVLFPLVLCCPAAVPSCCQGHCLMAKAAPRLTAVAPSKTMAGAPVIAAIAPIVSVAPLPQETGAVVQRFDPLTTIQLRI